MSRNILHKTKLLELKKYLDIHSIPYRDVAHSYQVLQIQWKIKDNLHWLGVFLKDEMKEHYSNDRRLDALIIKFCTWSRKNGE